LPETFGIELSFQSPFDQNGVLYHIGTAGGQREYRNPHSAGDVVARTSSHQNGSPACFVQHTHATPVAYCTGSYPDSTAVVTWQPPESSALPVVAFVVHRAVGVEGRYAPAGRTVEGRFEQRVDDQAGQSVRYRVQAEDEGGNLGAWAPSPAVQLPETFGIELSFQSPFDQNGVLYHIGTAGGQREYRNPHSAGDVVARTSSHQNGSPACFVQHTHATPVAYCTGSYPDSTAVVTWQPPKFSVLPVVAYVVHRAVGVAGRYAHAGRTVAARFEQRVDDQKGQCVRYRVKAEDEGGNLGAWTHIPAVQLPVTFAIELRFQSPFDRNGALYHIGTAGGQREYQNPHRTGDVVARMFSIFLGSPAHFVQHTHAFPVSNLTSNQPFSGWRWTF
jgi:hypothetical protein